MTTLPTSDSDSLKAWAAEHNLGLSCGIGACLSAYRRDLTALLRQAAAGRHARLEWVRSSVQAMLTICEQRDVEAVGMPRIAAGIGGLSWPDVAGVFEDLASPSLVQVVVVSLPDVA